MRLSSLAPLRHRDFARFWTGAFISNIGTWMETIAIATYVTSVTGKAVWTGAVAAAGFVPTAVLGPIGGALADRLERRKLLLGTMIVQTGLAAILTALFVIGEPGPLTVTLIVLAGGIAMALGFPAYQSLLPELVPTEELAGAIALSSAQWNLGRVIGPAIAGIVISLGDYAWALGINTASFFAVIVVLVTLRLPKPTVKATEGLFASIVDGVRFVRRDPGLRVNTAAMALTTFVAAPFIALVAAMAIEVFHSEDIGTSILVTAQGIGAVVMGLSVGPLANRFGARRIMLGAMAFLAPALVAYAYAPVIALSAVAIFFVGGAYLAAIASFMTIAQLRAPGHLRGRVLSVNNVLLGSAYPLGALLQGALGDAIGLRATTALSGVTIAVAMLVVRFARPHVTDAIESPTVLGTPLDDVPVDPEPAAAAPPA
jgi:MFS family permease